MSDSDDGGSSIPSHRRRQEIITHVALPVKGRFLVMAS